MERICRNCHFLTKEHREENTGRALAFSLSQQEREKAEKAPALKRDFYLQMCQAEGWSTRTLQNRLDSMLFERTALSRQPDELLTTELDALREEGELTPALVLKDPYVAADKGQMELYLRWLAKHEQEPGEAPPLGIILCSSKKREQIELLELDRAGIHVAEYLTELPPKELLQRKLHEAIVRSRQRLDQRSGELAS